MNGMTSREQQFLMKDSLSSSYQHQMEQPVNPSFSNDNDTP